MPLISSENGLPKLLNNPSKRAKRAKKLAASHLHSSAKRIDPPPM